MPGTIAELSERLSNLTEDEATASAHAEDPIIIGSRTYSREDAAGILGRELDSLSRNILQTSRVPLGIYRGLRFGLVLNPHFGTEVYLEGATSCRSGFLREHKGPRAVLNAVERLANSYGSECSRVRQELGIAESQLRDYQARLGKPFPHDAYLSLLTTLRDQLKRGLSGTTPEPGSDPQPSISELAEQIKALKAANTIEATPERVGKGHSSAEEPVTERIRRRAEALPTPDPAFGSGADVSWT